MRDLHSSHTLSLRVMGVGIMRDETLNRRDLKHLIHTGLWKGLLFFITDKVRDTKGGRKTVSVL
jgi:hypothetical protein